MTITKTRTTSGSDLRNMVTIAIVSSTSTGVAVGETARSSVDGADGPSSVSVDAEQIAGGDAQVQAV